MNKIGIGQLAEAVKKSIIENGGGEERAKQISEIVINKLVEIGYRSASLTQGANYNARQQYNNDVSIEKNRQKIDRSRDLTLSALNNAIKNNFSILDFHFIAEKMGLSFTISFNFKEIKFIDKNRVVMGGIFNRKSSNETYKGSVEYSFNNGSFYQVNFYGQGSVRRLFPMTLDIKSPEYKKTAYDFLTFISNYLYSVEDYQTNVNKNYQ